MIRDIRIAERWMGKEDLYIDESVKLAKNKLERSIATKRDLAKGEVIRIEDIHLLSPGDGIKWIEKDLILEKKLKEDIQANEIIYPYMIE